MSKHTPGPWQWDADGFLWSAKDPQFEVANGGHVYHKADRDLIAAAPEMLSFLEELALQADAPCDNELAARLFSLIAKARGKS